jgi:hypothetical protein
MSGIAMDVLDEAPLLLIQRPLQFFAQQLGKPNDGVERRA